MVSGSSAGTAAPRSLIAASASSVRSERSPTSVVREVDERPQQIGRLGQVLCRRHDLTGNPVVEQDLHLHRAPAQWVAWAVVGAIPEQGLEQAAVIGIVEPGSIGRAKELIREPGKGRRIPLWPLVSGSTFGQAPGDPFDQCATRGPGLGLQRREGDRGQFDRRIDPGSRVGEADIVPPRVRVLGHPPEFAHHVCDRRGYDEGVLHQGAEVMVDVDQAGELVSARQPRPEHDVVAVAENVTHPHRPIGGRLRKLCKPCRFDLRARCELSSDAGTQHVIVTRHLGDHREQRRRFRKRLRRGTS